MSAVMTATATAAAPNGRYDVPCPTSALAPPAGHPEFGVTPNIHATEEEARDVAYLEALKRLNAANPKSDLVQRREPCSLRTVANRCGTQVKRNQEELEKERQTTDRGVGRAAF